MGAIYRVTCMLLFLCSPRNHTITSAAVRISTLFFGKRRKRQWIWRRIGLVILNCWRMLPPALFRWSFSLFWQCLPWNLPLKHRFDHWRQRIRTLTAFLERAHTRCATRASASSCVENALLCLWSIHSRRDEWLLFLQNHVERLYYKDKCRKCGFSGRLAQDDLSLCSIVL